MPAADAANDEKARLVIRSCRRSNERFIQPKRLGFNNARSVAGASCLRWSRADRNACAAVIGSKNMAIRHEFEANSGYRFFKDGVSILLQVASRFRQGTIVTNKDLFHDFQRINKALQDMGAYDGERQGVSNLMTANHFPPHKGREFYKFLPERSLDYYKEGSFQFGSIQYYRSIEQQNSKDSMEGLSNLAIKTPRHLFGMSLASGYNFALFCGTSTLSRREQMSARFGPRIIRIANLQLFAQAVQSLLGAKKFYFNKVVYNDLKMFRIKTLKTVRLSRTEPPGNFDPQLIDEAIFDLLYGNSFLPSLFMKPTRFSIEEELRLVFETPEDVPPPHVLIMKEKALLKHVEIIQ